jgi:hypothetical protein
MVDEKLKSLDSLLKDLEGAARQNGDSALLSKGNEARKALDEHGALYRQTVEALDGNKKQELVMDAKGAIVDEELDAFMKEKKAEYIEAKDGLALLNSIYALTLDMRMREKSYMVDADNQHIKAIEINGGLALEQCDQLDKLNRNETEKKQIGLVKAAIQEHLNGFRAFAAEYQKDPNGPELPQLVGAFNKSGDKATQITEDYTLVKQSAVEKVAQAVFAVRELNKEAFSARICEKSFIITKEPKYWELLNEHIRKLTDNYRQAAENFRVSQRRTANRPVGAGDKRVSRRGGLLDENRYGSPAKNPAEYVPERRARDHGGASHRKRCLGEIGQRERSVAGSRQQVELRDKCRPVCGRPCGLAACLGYLEVHHPPHPQDHRRSQLVRRPGFIGGKPDLIRIVSTG